MFSDVIHHDILGDFFIFWDSYGRVAECTMDSSHHEYYSAPANAEEMIPEIYNYLRHYGDTERPPFPFERLDFGRASKFTMDIYRALFDTPRGSLITYAELALKAGYPRAHRAAGSAMRKNKHLMLLPCHRVIGSNNLGNFASGMHHKIHLMELEGHTEFLMKFPQYHDYR